MEKIHFISYGDEKYKVAKERIYNEAINTNWFDSINCYGKEYLTSDFVKEFKNILLMNRGGGYWIWKFDIILNKLQEINNGDFLIYADSGCSINLNGKKRFYEYIEMIKNNKYKIISFELSHQERQYTTKQIFDIFNIPENDIIENSYQLMATVIIMQKCDAVISIFKDCLDKIRINPLLITDHYNINQRIYFKDNRHDQSILSIARKIHGSIILSDETWDNNFGSEYIKKKPFLATRKKN
jgi:hypothetical protein